MLRVTQVHPPLQIVTGKGGVGKSTVAAALAVAASRRGKQVLAIELSESAGLSGLLGVARGEPGAIVPVARGLAHSWFDGEAALAEFIVRNVPFGARLKPFFGHPLYRAFVSAGPGVRELMAIGKVRDELLGLSTGAPPWDLVVVDAGASGHALQLLGMPAATARTFASGLAHREATKVAATLEDPNTTAVHVVARPEVMPLEEAGETIERLRERNLPVGRLVVNQCWAVPPNGASQVIDTLSLTDPLGQSLRAAAERALGWSAVQEQGVARLEARVRKPALRLPRLLGPAFGRAEVDQLSELIAGEVTS